MRVEQKPGERGSLRAIQCLASMPDDPVAKLLGIELNRPIQLHWLSPRADDNFAEYRDAGFLRRIGAEQLDLARRNFWPERGPQWDGIACDQANTIWLIEAKAHIAEMLTPASQASASSRAQIETALEATCTALDAHPRAPWIGTFYQLANRIAWLHFPRSNNIDAKLLLLNVIGDLDMGGPASREAWEAAYTVAFHVMGLRKRHALWTHIHHVYPEWRLLINAQ